MRNAVWPRLRPGRVTKITVLDVAPFSRLADSGIEMRQRRSALKGVPASAADEPRPRVQRVRIIIERGHAHAGPRRLPIRPAPIFADLGPPRPSGAFVAELATRPELFRLLELARPVVVTGAGAGGLLMIIAGIETWATAWALASTLSRRVTLHGFLIVTPSPEPDAQAAWCLVACTAARIPTAPGAIAHLVLPQLSDRSGSHRGVRRQHLVALLGMSRQGLWKAGRGRELRRQTPDDPGPRQPNRAMAGATSNSP